MYLGNLKCVLTVKTRVPETLYNIPQTRPASPTGIILDYKLNYRSPLVEIMRKTHVFM
jgi:hypothetical protein